MKLLQYTLKHIIIAQCTYDCVVNYILLQMLMTFPDKLHVWLLCHNEADIAN